MVDVTETLRMYLAGDLDDDFSQFFEGINKDGDEYVAPEDAAFGGILELLFDRYDRNFDAALTMLKVGMPEEVWGPALEFNDSFLFVNLLRVLNSHKVCFRKSFDCWANAAVENFDENAEMVFSILGENTPDMMLRGIIRALTDLLAD